MTVSKVLNALAWFVAVLGAVMFVSAMARYHGKPLREIIYVGCDLCLVDFPDIKRTEGPYRCAEVAKTFPTDDGPVRIRVAPYPREACGGVVLP